MNVYQKDVNRLAKQYVEFSREFGFNTKFRSFRIRLRYIIKHNLDLEEAIK